MPENSEQFENARACTNERYRQARDYACLLLKFRPRSISEFKERLVKHGFSEEITNAVSDDFKRRGLLDDKKFAKIWVQDRLQLKPMGKLRLRLELEAKGVDKTDIEDAFGAAAEINEYQAAIDLARKRLKQVGSLNKIAAKRRLTGFLQRRGFSYEVIRKALSHISADPTLTRGV
jgi:regulatory protein